MKIFLIYIIGILGEIKMIVPKRYSYSGLSLWKVNPARFYCRYLSENPLKREPATIPMRVGTAIDELMKFEMETDLGLPTEKPVISEADMALIKDMYQWFHDSGVYLRMVDYFKLLLDQGGEVMFEGEVKREFEHACGVPFNVLGYFDFGYRTSKTAPWSILDLKSTGLFQTRPSSPRAPYNEVVYKDGRTKIYSKFEPCEYELDTLWGIGEGSVPKMHKDQVSLYSYVLNHDVEGIEWDGKHRVGIVQLQPTYVGLSYGVLTDTQVMEDFRNLHACVIAGKPFGLEWSDQKTKDEMDKWDDDRMRACMLPTNFY